MPVVEGDVRRLNISSKCADADPGVAGTEPGVAGTEPGAADAETGAADAEPDAADAEPGAAGGMESGITDGAVCGGAVVLDKRALAS